MTLNWDAAPGPVRKYLITYKHEEGEAKEVILMVLSLHYCKTFTSLILSPVACSLFEPLGLMAMNL